MDKTNNHSMTKKTAKALALGASVVALSSGVISPAEAANGTGAMSAVLLTPITISAIQILHFGQFTAPVDGFLTVEPDGNRIVPAAMGDVASAPTAQQGIIQITGAPAGVVDVSIPAAATPVSATVSITASAATAAIVGGYPVSDGVADTMPVGNFFLWKGNNTAPTTSAMTLAAATDELTGVTLDATGGLGYVHVGAQIIAETLDAAGTYTGNYDIVANYQ